MYLHAGGHDYLHDHEHCILFGAVSGRDSVVGCSGGHLRRQDAGRLFLDYAIRSGLLYFWIFEWSNLCIIPTLLRGSKEWSSAGSHFADQR